ncbi:hypothetical protein DN400_18975 [Bacillus sp. AR8-1]|nr:hypothetical protein DN400_18975 [Bacillus sp. AR8-1]
MKGNISEKCEINGSNKGRLKISLPFGDFLFVLTVGTRCIGGDKCEEAEKCPHCYSMQEAYFPAIFSYSVLWL